MPKHSIQFQAIGTSWSIETDVQLSETLVKHIHERIEAFDQTYSRFRGDSLVSRISTTPGLYVFPEDADELFTFYEKLYDSTDGKVTPLIGSMLEKAGYDAEYSFQPQKQIRLPALPDTIDRKGNTLRVLDPVMIDIGAAGKGYLVDAICQLLDDEEINEYVVDASGDMRHKGKDENRVGLEHPLDPSKVIGIVNVQNVSMCASATNRRKWGNGQHHIYDPELMEPTQRVIATWVMADSTMVADGIATALFFAEPAKLRTEFSFEFVRMFASGAIDYSHSFEGELF